MIDNRKDLHSEARLIGGWLHQGPGDIFRKIGKAEKYGKVQVIEQTSDSIWTKVRCMNVEGWVISSKV